MIQAYHYVEPPPLGQITVSELLEKGAIFPAAFRVQPDIIEHRCEQEMDIYQDIGTPMGLRGLRILMAERSREVADVSSGTTRGTGFYCEDLLAGDALLVFLSVSKWGIADAEVIPNGFVFDAEEIIRRGASLRMGDLQMNFGYAIENALMRDYPSPAAARDSLKRALAAVLARYQFSGNRALRLLRKDPAAYREIVFPGPIALDWAIEAWENGELTASRGYHERRQR